MKLSSPKFELERALADHIVNILSISYHNEQQAKRFIKKNLVLEAGKNYFSDLIEAINFRLKRLGIKKIDARDVLNAFVFQLRSRQQVGENNKIPCTLRK